MLADRLDGAFDLYRSHKAGLLLFTGDNGTVQYNELAAMMDYARRRGIPAGSIVGDYAGFNTYDSCYRAKRIFGVRSAVLVTQSFHLARALFICRSMGINAVGYPRPDWGVYSNSMMFEEDVVRESLARVKALIQARFTKPVPEIMGSPLPLRR